MRFYSFMLRRYNRKYEQIKCFASFLGMMLPVIVFIVLMRHRLSFAFHGLLLLAGWCTWTFFEYVLHRFWMHDKNSSLKMAEYHQHHHSHPTERVITNTHRMLMVTVVGALGMIAIYVDNYFTFFVGFCCGIEGYFLLHEMIHLRIGQRVFKKLVRYHIYHHCKYPNTCYGVSVTWWDDLFKTVPAAPMLTQRIIDFYFKGNAKEREAGFMDHAITRGEVVIKTENCNGDCSACSMSVKN
jgi:sterol desaturase/sphingolipid hydroxylase (fatty acid hydroxylase superfamily)